MGVKVAAEGTLSLVYGAELSSEREMGSLSIPGYLQEVVARYSEREALVIHTPMREERWSYRELWTQSCRVAKALMAVGVVKDTRVGILMSNRPEFLSAFFGITMAGGVPVALSTFSTASELDQLLQLSELSILLLEERVLKRDFASLICELEPGIAAGGKLQSDRFPYLKTLVLLEAVDLARSAPDPRPGFICWDDFLALGLPYGDQQLEARRSCVQPSDRGGLFFSSGTTSLPKGIIHTQRAFAIQWWRYPTLMRVGAGEIRSWTGNGFFWSANITMNVGLALSTGGAVVLQPYFEAEAGLRLFEEERVSYISGRPHQWARFQEASNWSTTDLSSLKYITRAEQLQSHPTVNTDWEVPMGYGNTETMSINTSNVYDPACDSKKEAFGVPCPGNILKIVDPQTREILPVGRSGEVCIKGPTLMEAYLGKAPEDTFDRDGFLCTGDGGYVDSDGCLFFEGRLTEIIKTGGANVSPLEIDTAISLFPGVRRAQTVGMPDDILGERVVSCIVPHDGQLVSEAELRLFLKEKLASFKSPKQILFVSEEDITVTGTGKVKVLQLRELVAKRLAEAVMD